MYFCLDPNPKGDISLVGGNPSPLCVCVYMCVDAAGVGFSQEAQTGSTLTFDPWLSASSGVMHTIDTDSW